MKNRIVFVLTIIIISCVPDAEEYKFNTATNENVIKIDTKPDSIELILDGVNSIPITILVPEKIDSSINHVNIETSIGVFTENGLDKITIECDRKIKSYLDQGYLVGRVTLKSTNQNKRVGFVVAEVKGFEARSRVVGVTAFADSIFIEADKFVIENNYSSEIKITASLKRSPGLPTQGQKVNFRVLIPGLGDVTNPDNFRDINNRSNDKGETSLLMTIGDIDYEGDILIEACTETSKQVICDTMVLRVKKAT